MQARRNCREPGHRAAKCEVPCGLCNTEGHKRKECEKKLKLLQERDKVATEVALTEEEENESELQKRLVMACEECGRGVRDGQPG